MQKRTVENFSTSCKVEKERQMAKMEEDMRYYQLELVNREQNYNAMFSANPQVGLLNPLQPSQSSSSINKKSKEKPVNRQARFRNRDHQFGDFLTSGHRCEGITPSLYTVDPYYEIIF